MPVHYKCPKPITLGEAQLIVMGLGNESKLTVGNVYSVVKHLVDTNAVADVNTEAMTDSEKAVFLLDLLSELVQYVGFIHWRTWSNKKS